MLLELFAEKVESLCGHSPDQQMLAEYVAKTLKRDTATITPPTIRRPIPKRPTMPAVGYTGKSPEGYWFDGEYQSVRTFYEILMGLCEVLYRKHSMDFEQVFNLRGHRREYFSRDYKILRQPKGIADSGIYVETHLSANAIIQRCHQLLNLFGYSENILEIKVRDD